MIARAASIFVLSMASTAEDEVVFRSDVSLVRVDVQVADDNRRPVTGLKAEDFVLREGGRIQEIRNFASEEMPLDVLMLFDVSVSMRPHVERVLGATSQALAALGREDRVGVMVFDRLTRVRLPFRQGREEIASELRNVIRREKFNGGTDITRALLDAADYVGRSARRDARRAIVIVTDDRTERERDEDRVVRALANADAVLSALIAPEAFVGRARSPMPGGRPPMGRRGGGWPGGGYPGGGGGYPGGGAQRPAPPKSAGTEVIAQESGGDSLPVSDASALETTLTRLRQRYALHFIVPAGVRAGQERNISVELAESTHRRFRGAELRFRRTYVATTTTPAAPKAVPAEISSSDETAPRALPDPEPVTPRRRRPAVTDSRSPKGPLEVDP